MARTKLEKRVIEVIKDLPKYNGDKRYKTDVVYSKDIFYLKLYYDEKIDYTEVEKVYNYMLNAFLNVNYRFQGVVEYKDNNEICLTFMKKDF